jgi:Carboxypeptidase regulatory-like domain
MAGASLERINRMNNSRQPLRTLSQAQRERHSTSFIFTLLIISACLSASNTRAQTVAPSPQAESEAPNSSRSQSTVRGRVVYDDTLRPLRRVSVTIYDPSGSNNSRRQHRMAWTDGNGEFVIKDLFAGKYYVTVDAPGIIRQEVFESGADLSGVATASVNGINSAEVKVRVRRGAVISGKVTYSDGDPAINATISVMRKKDGQIIPFYINEDCGHGIQTDERGFYRVSGMPPGEYVVGASEQKMSETIRGNEEGSLLHRSLLATTYYDGNTNARGATPVQVDAGNEINNINITLIERSTHSISGTLTMRGTNLPVTRAMVNLDSKEDSSVKNPYFFESQVATLDAKGQWSFDDVEDGVYTITVSPMRDHKGYTVGSADSNIPAEGTPQSFIVKRQDVTIGGNDLTGLVIELSTGGRISGTVTVEGGRAAIPPSLSIAAEAAIGERRIPSAAQIRPDGTFTLDGMPSDGIWLRAVSWRDKRYYTKSVTANGVDLMNEPLMVKDGQEVKGVQIVISPEVATLTGRILVAEGGATFRGASILLVRVEPHLQRIRSERLYGYTNADGGFTLTGAPGEYFAIVIRPGVELYGFSDASIKARLADAQRITLQPNEHKKMDFIAPEKK